MNFLKNVLASALGTFVAFLLMLIVFVLIIMVAAFSSNDKVSVKDNSILHIELNQEIAERGNENGGQFDPSTFQTKQSMGLDHFIADLAYAKTDSKIQGVFLEIGNFAASPSTVYDMRKAISDFKSSGKWIVAYSENYSQGAYYVASAANEVYMYPTGTFDWRGLSAEIMFYKQMLDKLEIEAQVIRGPNNKFKSAVEPFIYDHMSPENKEQISTFVGDMWRTMCEGIAADRGVTVDFLNQAADSLTFRDVRKVKEAGLLNGLSYRDEVISLMKTKVGLDAQAEKGFNLIAMSDYHGTAKSEVESDNKIAVVYAVGAIESGEGDDETIGSDRIAKALRDARLNEKVKAIVLRVNSPGGSALASDVIWRETQLIRDSGKPLVVSMGDYAASGGYYIACNANKIYANPTTLTGSIGVFGVVPNMQKFFNNKLGLTFDSYETNAHAGMLSVTKPFDDVEMKAMQDIIAQIYDDFTSKVATGRGKTQAEVDSIGQGRVWSGEDAKNLGLVDEMGGLNDAIKSAAQMAGLSEYEMINYPKLIDPFEELISDLTGQKQASVMQEIFGDHYVIFENVKSIQNMKGPQARLPFVLEIR
ncbi:MAG: signal peptide peptidase SppA [Flavobacteriales bacterium]